MKKSIGMLVFVAALLAAGVASSAWRSEAWHYNFGDLGGADSLQVAVDELDSRLDGAAQLGTNGTLDIVGWLNVGTAVTGATVVVKDSITVATNATVSGILTVAGTTKAAGAVTLGSTLTVTGAVVVVNIISAPTNVVSSRLWFGTNGYLQIAEVTNLVFVGYNNFTNMVVRGVQD